MRRMLLPAAVLSILVAGCASAAPAASNADTPLPLQVTRVAADPTAEAYYHYAVAQMHAQAARFEQAVAELREAIRRDPRSAVLWGQLAQWLARLDQGEEALAAARKAVEFAPDPRRPASRSPNSYAPRSGSRRRRRSSSGSSR